MDGTTSNEGPGPGPGPSGVGAGPGPAPGPLGLGLGPGPGPGPSLLVVPSNPSAPRPIRKHVVMKLHCQIFILLVWR